MVEKAVEQCQKTLIAKVNITPDLLQSLLDKFAEFGVSKEQIEARIQRRMDAITPAQVIQLGEIYNALKDGMGRPSDWFSAAETEGKTEQKKSRGTVNIDEIKQGKENRGHGKENLGAAAGTPEPASSTQEPTPEPTPSGVDHPTAGARKAEPSELFDGGDPFNGLPVGRQGVV